MENCEEVCQICYEDLTPKNRQILPCRHSLCKVCIEKMVKFRNPPKCLTCNKFFAPYVGKQPQGGSMHITKQPSTTLPGFIGCGTLLIHYSIPSSVQKEYHPNPGMAASGTSRAAYLPDNDRGRQLANLLKKAFDQKLVFTVGRSITTQVDNTVIWNDIHHKTTTHGTYGYPDPTYLDRLEQELREKGVTY